jgi:hypothetical protein
MGLKVIKVPDEVVRLQRFFRELRLMSEDEGDENEDDTASVCDRQWSAIKENWNIVRGGIVGLVETVEKADERIASLERMLKEGK